MKLSDAIALGSVDSKACPNVIASPGTNNRCAIGMALHAIGVPDEQIRESRFDEFRAFSKIVKSPCGCTVPEQSLAGIIAHLFDRHVFVRSNWTLPQLIEWVRSIEAEEVLEEEKQAEPDKTAVLQEV